MTLGQYPVMTLADAREAWRKARKDAGEGRDPASKREATDFEGVAREWLQRDQAKNRTHDDVKRVVERELIPAWGQRPISDISRRNILDLIDGIADRDAVTMARRVLAYVHRLLAWSVQRGIIEANPASNLPKPGSETKRDRVLSDAELKAVWSGAVKMGWPFGDAIRLLILTGARREEIGGLRWSEIADTQICMSSDRTKGAKAHSIPLSKLALAIIETMPRIKGDEDFVFTITGSTTISGWSKIKTDLDEYIGIEPWRIHDLKRTVATGLQRLGIGLQVIEAVLGHVSGSRGGVVGVYQRHSFDKEKAAALEAWGAHVAALVEGKEPSNVLPLQGAKKR